jgi:Tfp pilus assembly protein PilZ
MIGATTAERRAHVRACLSVPVRLRVDGTDEVFRHVTKNISPSGIFIDTRDPLPIGTDLNIRFHIPDLDVQIQAEGRVIRIQPPGMAIRFTGDALMDVEVLQRLVEGRR